MCRVWSRIVMLKNSSGGGHKKQHMQLEDVLDVELSCQRALDTDQLAPACAADGSPHHDSPTAMWRCFIHTGLSIAFVDPTINTSASVVTLKKEL